MGVVQKNDTQVYENNGLTSTLELGLTITIKVQSQTHSVAMQISWLAINVANCPSDEERIDI